MSQGRERPGSGQPARRPSAQELNAEQAARVALLESAAISRAALRRLVRRCGSALALLHSAGADLGEKLRAALPPPARAVREAQRALDALGARGIRVLLPGSGEFPAALAAIPDPPLLLYARGSLPSGPALAVVGSRRATARGRAVARALAEAVARQGVAVVSGLAYGIDAAAHRGALDGGGSTVAVLASGIDEPSPSGNRPLADEILVSGGAWISEHPPQVPARPEHFPERNRLISGLAAATLIVEARERSGSLWTARHALDQGRDVLVVPGPIDTDACLGSNRLLRDGAAPVLEPADLLAALGASGPPGASSGREPGAQRSALARELLARLRSGPANLDGLAAELCLSVPELAALVLDLELEGSLRREGSRISLARPLP